MNARKIIVVDPTIREGMQYHGLVFSLDQRMEILRFQEALGIDISQAGYPPAHKSEAENVERLFQASEKKGYAIRVAGLFRALEKDVKPMLTSGFKDFHLHMSLTKEMLERKSLDEMFGSLERTINLIRKEVKDPFIDVNVLDIGNMDIDLIKRCAGFLIDKLEVDILTLPDTSGIMSPNLLFEMITSIVKLTAGKKTGISVHCHNDMGMATANTVMGAAAGASAVQATALGIGERNGIGDIFLVGKALKEQGYQLNLKTEKIDLFEQYYEYVNNNCMEQTGFSIMNYNTPFFGTSMKTHVAGTHGITKYGKAKDEAFFLNVLCGRSLVIKYLELNNIRYDNDRIKEIVNRIKDKSANLGRSASKEEVIEIVSDFV